MFCRSCVYAVVKHLVRFSCVTDRFVIHVNKVNVAGVQLVDKQVILLEKQSHWKHTYVYRVWFTLYFSKQAKLCLSKGLFAISELTHSECVGVRRQ